MEPRYPQRTRNRDLEIAEDASNDNENEEDASVGEDGDKDREDEEDDTDEDDDDEDDDDEEDDDEEDVEQLPYPGFRPIALRYLDQRSRPRKWCLAMMTNPYPFPTRILISFFFSS